MVSFTRMNAWNNDGTFNNPDLLWYAKGVGAMQARALDDANSWWFFAAIHGEYVKDQGYPGWGSIPPAPQVPTTPVPTKKVQKQYWNQCQHQSWYFPPWHRGYLIALEAQIRAAVVNLGGPSTWALPYWNYLGPDDQYKIPPAFTQQTLPDGSSNPLYVTARYGPNSDGDIFIPIPPVSRVCQSNDLYTGSSPATPMPGYGGPKTGFSHGGQTSGNLESNPHNQVHVDVGGNSPNGKLWGLMSDPGIAALDPIFYLHHSNIDRMWAIWNANGNQNPIDPNWLKGPAAVGQRDFVMPMPGGNTLNYTPADVNSLSQLNYTYDDISTAALPKPVANALTRRLRMLGVSPTKTTQGGNMESTGESELVGASDGNLQIRSSGARTTVRLDADVRRKVSASLESASGTAPPDHVYLKLENVRGTRDAHKFHVYVNDQMAGTVAGFGLRRASFANSQHGGEGLTFLLDITNIVDTLYFDNALAVDSLDVRIVPSHAVPDDANFSVGRVSVYRQGHQ